MASVGNIGGSGLGTATVLGTKVVQGLAVTGASIIKVLALTGAGVASIAAGLLLRGRGKSVQPGFPLNDGQRL